MKHAVVVGAGIAGLIATKVLSEFFDRITLIDRDFLDVSAPRRGVAQASHLHVLLQKGRQVFEELFPGIDSELAQAGAREIDWGRDTAWLSRHGWFPREESGVVTRSCSRTLLEQLVRRRVLRLPHLDVIEGTFVKKLNIRTQGGHTFVESVECGNQSIIADWVVDTSGRMGGLHGQGMAQEINAFVGYASRIIEIPPSLMDDFKQLYIQMRPPKELRGGVLTPLEAGKYRVTLIGAGRDYPKAEEKNFLSFAKSLPDPRFCEILASARPITPITTYRRTAGRRILTSSETLPQNLTILGDAYCSFNPVYGHGMTIAALSGIELRKAFRAGDRGGIYRLLPRLTRLPWAMASSEDFRVPTVQTSGLSPGNKLLLRMVPTITDHVVQKAVECSHTHRQFLRVLHMVDEPTSLIPAVLSRRTNT